jgi:hypothetical protein
MYLVRLVDHSRIDDSQVLSLYLDASHRAKLLGGKHKFAIREAEPNIFANCEDSQ